MENQIYGYIRVSSRDQNEDRQVIAMREFGIAEKFRAAGISQTAEKIKAERHSRD